MSMDIKQVMLTMAERFASDNLIAPQQAQITREEWGTVALELQRLEDQETVVTVLTRIAVALETENMTPTRDA